MWFDAGRTFGVGPERSASANATALQAAFDFSASSGRELIMPSGVIEVDAVIDVGSNASARMHGATIRQVNAALPTLSLNGNGIHLAGGQLGNAAVLASQTADACALRCINLSFSSVTDLVVWNVRNGIMQDDVDTGTSSFYSNHFDSVRVQNISGQALNLNPVGGGNTGTVFTNFYCGGSTSLPTSEGVGYVSLQSTEAIIEIGGTHQVTFDQLNIEWFNGLKRALWFKGSSHLVVSGLAIEGLRMSTNNVGMVRIGGRSTVSITGMTMRNCDLNFSTAGALFRFAADDSTLDVAGLYIDDFDWFTEAYAGYAAPHGNNVHLVDARATSGNAATFSGYLVGSNAPTISQSQIAATTDGLNPIKSVA